MTIDTPVEKVLEFVEDPDNLVKCSPIIERVADVRRSERRVGNSARFICRVIGVTFSEECSVVGFEAPRRQTPHRRFQLKKTFHGHVRGTVTWTLEAEGNQTYASLDAAYQLIGGVFGRAIDALFVERAIQKGVDQMLENIKRLAAR